MRWPKRKEFLVSVFEKIKDFFRSYPFVGVTLIVMLLSGVGWWYIRYQTEAYRVELDRMTKQGTETMGLVAMRGMMGTELETVKEAVRRTNDSLLIEENLAENLWYFYSVEGRTSTRLTELRQLDPPTPGANDNYLRVPYELSASGDFVGITEFMRQLETGPRLMRINEFSIRRDTGAEDMLSLDLSVELLGEL